MIFLATLRLMNSLTIDYSKFNTLLNLSLSGFGGMGIFDKEIVLESLGATGQDQYTKNVPHYAPAGRSVAGSYVMALGLMAAYNTVPSDFQVHHITAQFVQPGAKDSPLTFDVNRSSDRKNNAARIVFISQLGTRISMITIDFIRRPVLDGLSLNYQTQFPEGIEPPDDEIDDMKFFGRGLLHGQGLGRVMNSDRIEENKTRQWLKSGSISSQAGGKMHHAGLAFLTDQFILDTPARLQNLQLGLGEAEVGTSQKDSPYNKRSTRQSSNMADFRTSAPSDFRVLTTLNHTIHFCDPGAVKADEWILMEASTTFAHGGRVLIHSKLFARDGKILAVCTQEGYYRVKKGAGHKIQQSNL